MLRDSNLCCRPIPVTTAITATASTAITAGIGSLMPADRSGCRFLAPAPLLAGMWPRGCTSGLTRRRPAMDRRQGGNASMHVHMPERSVGQERAREAAHDWIRWHPLLERTYVTEGVHVRSRHVIPLLIPSTSSGFVSLRNAPRQGSPMASTCRYLLLIYLLGHVVGETHQAARRPVVGPTGPRAAS